MTWPQRIALTLYGWLMHALVPLLLYKLRRRGRDEPLYLQRIGQRLGRYDDAPQPAAWFWVHAVSLGETRAAALLIEQLRAARPDIRILLTHGTATGWAQGQALLRPGDAQAWLPWDTPRATGRARSSESAGQSRTTGATIARRPQRTCCTRGSRRAGTATSGNAKRMAFVEPEIL